MLVLSGYENLVKLYSGERSRVYRGYSLRDATSVIIKVPQSNYPTVEQLQRYRQEYRLSHRLKLPNVVRSYRLEEWARTLAIVFEDFGGISLHQFLKSSPAGLPLDRFFTVALAVTKALGQLHNQNVIHKDLNPKNIAFNPQSEVLKIIDLGISSPLNPDTPSLDSPTQLEGTLAYLSPEQTGRVAQKLDHRTDFYALGVTFYQLLTGQLPFTSTDSMELIHYHLVRQPPRFRERTNREIPEGVEAIVRKLMAKNADDRFQSAWGLQADLEYAQWLWQSQEHVPIFLLGQQDVPDRLQIPHKLYGREAELETLRLTWERVSQTVYPHQAELMVIQGDAGLGKLSLAQSLQTPVSAPLPSFIVGKFDPFQVTIPYRAIALAFTDLVKQRLTESEAQIATWRSQLLEAFGTNGQVLTTVIPELELIVGPQPPVPGLGGTEGKNRFLFVFRRFVQTCCQADRPLILVLEDGQWADADTLNLLEYLLGNPIPYFLPLILTLNGEVSPDRPLGLLLKRLEAHNVRTQVLSLSLLTLHQVVHLLRDTLQQDLTSVQPLAEVVYQKTQGNPFVLRQFLSTIAQNQYVYFQPRTRQWQWNLQAVRSLELMENVVDVVLRQLETLSPTAQETLGLAACFGLSFDLMPLSWVSDHSPQEILEQLQSALGLGLILPRSLGEGEDSSQSYQFSHERIQQSAYARIPLEQRSQLHYRIGRKLLTHISPQEYPKQIFELVRHLNRGIDILTDDRERLELAQLNLMAAQQSQAATAYETGLNYAELGLSILGEQGWTLDKNLTLNLHEMKVQLLGLCGQWSEAKDLINTLEERRLDPLDLVNFYRSKVQFEISQHRLIEAITLGRNILKKLGFDLPEQPSAQRIKSELLTLNTLLQNRSIRDLAQLPEMDDRQQRGITEIITSLVSPTYLCGSPLFPLVVTLSVRLSIQHGNILASGFAYACYGILACNLLNNIPLGVEFGELALAIGSQKEHKIARPQVLYVVTAFILQRTAHLKDHLHFLRTAYSIGLEVGNLEYGGYAYQHLCLTLFALGHSLDRVGREIFYATSILADLDQQTIADYCQIYAYAVKGLQETNYLKELNSTVEEYQHLWENTQIYEGFKSTQNCLGLCLFHFCRLILACLFGYWKVARQESNMLQSYWVAALGSLIIPFAHFYDSLAILADLKREDNDFENQWKRVEENQVILQEQWVSYAPMNYQHKLDLILAEKYRVLGDYLNAIEAYDRAISGAKNNGFLQDEALAHERTAQFYLSWEKQMIARTYLQEAYYVYTHWGALVKAETLRLQYPDFFDISPRSAPDQTNTIVTTEGKDLDLQTIIKASQAITGEIVFENLVQTLMQILKENLGAEICALLLASSPLEKNLSLAIYSHQEGITMNPKIPLEDLLPKSIISYVNRTSEPIIFGSLNQEYFLQDSYVRKYEPQSILCYPLLKQGDIIGIVYLENRLVQGTFSSDRFKLLELLSGQIVIALQNAQLYAKLQGSQKQLQQFLEAIPLGIGIIDREGHPYYTNRTAEEILGKGVIKDIGSDEIPQVYQNYIVGTNQSYPPDQLPIVKALRGEFSHVEDIEIRQGDRVIPLAAWGTPIYDEDGTVQYGMVTFQDISERRQAEQILQDSEDRYRVLAEMSPVGIFRNNLRGECIYANLKLQEMSGLSQEDFIGGGWSRMVYPEDQSMMYDLWSNFVSEVQQNNFINYQIEYRYIAADGSIRWAMVEALPERNSVGEVVGFVGATIDIDDRKRVESILSDYSHSLEEKVRERTTALAEINAQLKQEILDRKRIEGELRNANNQLKRLANLDGLTQVANRRKFDEYLTQEWYRHLRTKQPLSLILFDVDDFKRYNDSYGHQKGDECLIQITQAIKPILHRSTDLFARYGGEEFVIILPNTPVEGAIVITQQIQMAIHALEIPHLNSRVNAIVSVSIGIASLIPTTDASPEDLIERADQALYQAKANGRDRYVISSENSPEH